MSPILDRGRVREHARLLGNQHLPAARDAFDPGSLVDVVADQIGSSRYGISIDFWCPGVQPDPDAHRTVADEYRRLCQSLLNSAGTLNGFDRMGERDEERITDRLQFMPPVPRDAVAYCGVMLLECREINFVADLPRDSRRVDDVGEHHRYDTAADERHDLPQLLRIDPGQQLFQSLRRRSLVGRHPPSASSGGLGYRSTMQSADPKIAVMPCLRVSRSARCPLACG